MPSQKSRRSRKRHSTAKAPRAVPSRRRDRADAATQTRARAPREVRGFGGTTYGERPPGFFGGVPVSEVAIAAGGVGAVIGWVRGGGPVLIVGLIVCALGVIELTAREHFSGYRSHATLLALIVAVALEAALGQLVARHDRPYLLVVMVPAFVGTFYALKKAFTVARQARVRALPRA